MLKPIIAVIDSGIDENYYSVNRELFAGLYTCDKRDNEKYFVENIFPKDFNGHGTMVVDMVKMLVPQCKFLIMKILNRDCLATTDALVASLEFLCTQNVDVVHMSISVTQMDEKISEIIAACEILQKQGKRIVCSVENRKRESFPANLPPVFGVSGGVFENCEEYDFDPERKIQFICDATPSVVCGLCGKRVLFGGNSKAACIATAIIINELKKSSFKNKSELATKLVKSMTSNFHIIENSEIPYVRENRKIDLEQYEWCAKDFIENMCELFECNRKDIFSRRLIDVCDEITGEKFEKLFLKFSERNRKKICISNMRYVDFEWLWSLLEYVDKEYKNGGDIYEL